MTNKTKLQKKRIDYFDIAKGIGIILMILGHMSLQNKYINSFIYSFHMPLFFIISGYFFKKKENKICINNILKKLVLPYAITCIAIIIYKVFRLLLDRNFLEIANTAKIWGLAALYGSGSREQFGIRFIGAIWFLLALSWATYIMNLIYDKKERLLWVTLIAYVGYKTASYIWLPFSIQAGMVALLFLYIGVITRDKEIFNIRIPLILYIFLIAIMAFCTKYCGKLYMVSNYYENGLIDIIGGISGTFICIKLSMFIDKYIKIIKKILVFFGKNSLLCMCIHLFSLDCLNWVTIHSLLENIGIKRQEIRNTIINFAFVLIALIAIKALKKIWTMIYEKVKNHKSNTIGGIYE